MEYKIKAHVDMLKDNFAEHIQDLIMDNIPYKYEDDVFEFEIRISKIKNITKEVGVNKEGGRAFCDIKVTPLDEKTKR